ncbi:hypothetical protein CHS0354_040795 [Potamilus streckersoni]|uniref:Uncharacterized protein n=1 Tax=Potamilus streckersoni TaxID=2493646 RepID=A0AAE0SL31_9BIVA|nr:hypothetical protein CHS0354_040795 [Potamilus streckersoni]
MFWFYVWLFFCFVFLWRVFEQFYRNKRVPNLSTRYVFITGCDTGFGNLVARSLDAKGVPVFAGCLTEESAMALRDVCSSRLKTVQLDVTNKESVQNALSTVKENLPENQGLWGLVNNAGIMPNFCPTEFLTVGDFETVSSVNLFGTISVTLVFLPLIRKERGRIVNVSSVVGRCGIPGCTDYSVSKAAVRMFSSCLRRELYRSGVKVHTIEPGGFATQITNMNRLQEAFLKSYKQTDDEVKSFYSVIVQKVYNNFKPSRHHTFFMNGNPRMVSDAMEHAILAAHPNSSYLVGNDARYVFRFLHLLPERIVDLLMAWPDPRGKESLPRIF